MVKTVRVAGDPWDFYRRVELLAQRVHTLRPVVVQHQPARVGMALGRQPQQILNLTLVPVGCGEAGRHRREARPGRVYLGLHACPVAPPGDDVDQPELAGPSSVCLLYTSDAADDLLCV